MKKIFLTGLAVISMMAVSCKNNENNNENDNMGDTGLENTSSDVDKAVGDTMPVEVGTGMDTTEVGDKATVGAAADEGEGSANAQ